MITQASIQTVLDTARIEDVVRDYVNLRSRGSNLIGLCPFHKEKTPSFSVSPGRNICKCFGCGKGGDPLHFIMEMEQLTFPEAIRNLARRYNIALEETVPTKETVEQLEELESLNIINKWAKEYYIDQLWNTDEGQSIGLSYFKERGFIESTIRKFELGYANHSGDSLYQQSIKDGYKLNYVQKLGLVGSSQKDFFRERVIFPIHNQTGKVIGFAGRIMRSDVKVAKYINSSESEVYNKSKTLFGLHLAKNAIRKEDQVLLVEGYTDVMSLVQAGIENVTASSGTSLTEDQAQIIRRHTSNITILYDGDSAGIAAAKRGTDILIKTGLNIRIALIPDNNDPDSYIRKIGTDAFRLFLKNESKDFILFRLEQLNEETKNNPVLKANATNEIIVTIAKMDDPIKRGIYIQETARLLDISEQSIIQKCNQLIKDDLKTKAFADKRAALDRDERIIEETDSQDKDFQAFTKTTLNVGDFYQEHEIIKMLIGHGHLPWIQDGISTAQFIIDNISDVLEYFETDIYKVIIQEISNKLNAGEPINLQYYLSHSNPEIRNLALDVSAPKYEYSKNWSDRHGIELMTTDHSELYTPAEVEQVVKYLKVKKLDKLIQELDTNLTNIQDVEEQITMIKVREEYRKIRNNLHNEVWGSYL